MRQKRFLSMLATLMVGVFLSFAGTTEQASAQQNLNCCTWTFDVANVPANCFPINVFSLWDCGIFGPQVIVANGIQTFPIPTPCPPACVFFGVSLTGAPPWASFNNPKVYNVNGCCLAARISFQNGCVHVTIRPVNGPC